MNYEEHGFVKNKYMEDLGLLPHEYGTNFCDKLDEPERWEVWEKERETYGFDNRETWCVDRMFYEWLYSHLQMYLEYTIVDLTFYKFEYIPTGSTESITVTQEEAINIIKEEAKRMILQDEWDKDAKPFDTNIMILFSKILPALWW